MKERASAIQTGISRIVDSVQCLRHMYMEWQVRYYILYNMCTEICIVMYNYIDPLPLYPFVHKGMYPFDIE